MPFKFNPFTSRLDIVETSSSPTGDVQFLTGNDGNAVPPDGGGNIDVLGNNTQGINITGNIGTNTLTVAGIDASDTQKGVASFNLTNFTVIAGAVASNAITVNAGTGITIVGSPVNLGGAITISVDASVATIYTENVGSATPAVNNLNVLGNPGTNGIQTTGAGDTVTISMFSPFIDSDFAFQSLVPGATRTLTIENTTNVASSQATQNIQVAGGTAGDVWSQYTVAATRSYSCGVDNSDSDKLKWTTDTDSTVDPSSGTELMRVEINATPSPIIIAGGTPLAGLTPTGLGVIKDLNGSGISIELQNTHTAADAGSTAILAIRVNGDGDSDPITLYDINGIAGSAWRTGIDNNDSDKFKITAGAAGATQVMVATLAGEVTFPNQPAFLAYNSATDANQTGNGTTATVAFDTEIFDIGGDFAANTFTAPVTGIYRFSAAVLLDNVAATASAANIQFFYAGASLSTTNQFNAGAVRDVNNRTGLQASVLLSLAATNTVVVRVQVGGVGADTVGFFGDGNLTTYFCGELVS